MLQKPCLANARFAREQQHWRAFVSEVLLDERQLVVSTDEWR
jgi:hypothetical protein